MMGFPEIEEEMADSSGLIENYIRRTGEKRERRKTLFYLRREDE